MFIYLVGLFVLLYFVLTLGPSEQREKIGFLAIWTLGVALIPALGDMLGGYDRYIYGQVFDNTADDRARGLNIFTTTAFVYAEKEQGYAMYNYLLSYLTSNRYIFIFITTLLVYIAFFRHIVKYSKYPFTAFFIFFCLYYFFTFTYFRQVMALCVAWFAIPFAIKRKPIPFFAIIILSATFHNSALLFAGTYFISNRRFTPLQIRNIILWALILGLTPISSILFNTLGGAVNEEKADLSSSQVGGARMAYIIEAMFFLYIILKNYKKLGEDEMSLCMTNIALGFIFILCFFVRFPDGGRMSWYYLIGIVCIIAEILAKRVVYDNLKIVTMSVLTLLFLRILFAWGIQLRPYKTFLTNGYREGDEIWEKYEYDHSYDINKLYRPIFGPIKK